VIRPYPILRSDETTVRLPFHLGLSQRARPVRMINRPIAKEWVLRALRTLSPTLLALSLTTVAHAQGTMDFSGAQTLMGTFKTNTNRIESTRSPTLGTRTLSRMRYSQSPITKETVKRSGAIQISG
jgi:hypothetical protein